MAKLQKVSHLHFFPSQSADPADPFFPMLFLEKKLQMVVFLFEKSLFWHFEILAVCDKNYHYRDLRWFLQKDGEETQEQAKEKERMAEVIRGVSETNEPQREL